MEPKVIFFPTPIAQLQGMGIKRQRGRSFFYDLSPLGAGKLIRTGPGIPVLICHEYCNGLLINSNCCHFALITWCSEEFNFYQRYLHYRRGNDFHPFSKGQIILILHINNFLPF